MIGRRLVALAGLCALVILGSTACSSAGSGSVPTVTVTANDFSFHLSRSSVPAGKVHFVLQNQSKTYPHELWVYPPDQPKLNDMLAVADKGVDVDVHDYLQGVAGGVEDLAPGKTASFDATLKPGTYDLACFVASTIGGKTMVHYEMGMHDQLTVQ